MKKKANKTNDLSELGKMIDFNQPVERGRFTNNNGKVQWVPDENGQWIMARVPKKQ